MFYIFCHNLLYLIFRLLFRKQTEGRENLPEGGAVLVANHVSYLDPPVLGTSIPTSRRVFFMAKQELFQVPVFGPAIRALGAFPVKKGGADRRALKQALDLLEDGEYVLVFPQGTRKPNFNTRHLYSGAALLAKKAAVPMIPVGIVNTDKVLPPGRRFPRFPIIRVRIGQPVSVPSDSGREALEEFTAEAMRRVGELLA